MPFTPIWFTGFEAGIIPSPTSFTRLITATVKTGSYSVEASHWINTQTNGTLWTISDFSPQADIYFGCWSYPLSGNGATGVVSIRFYLSDGNYLKIQLDSGNVWNGYVNTSLVATGTLVVAYSTWRHLQVHISVSDAGTFDCRIDGVVNFTYSGDTKPGTGTTISSIAVYTNYNTGNVVYGTYLDDVVIGTGDWPGDLRVDGMQPSADTATAEWTPSTGATNYACIDERPPSDTDYISTTVTGQRTIVDLTDFDTTSKTPMGVNVYARMNKSNAAVDTIKYGVVSGGVEEVVDQSLTTVMTNYMTFLPLNPDGDVAWDDASLDALKLVFESVVT